VKITIEESEHCHCGCPTLVIRCDKCKVDWEILLEENEVKFCPGCGEKVKGLCESH